jgi:hypothetical protein
MRLRAKLASPDGAADPPSKLQLGMRWIEQSALARRSSGEGERGSLDVKRAAEGAFIIYFSIAHGVADPPFEITSLATKTVDLPVQNIFKKVKKKLARFRGVQ